MIGSRCLNAVWSSSAKSNGRHLNCLIPIAVPNYGQSCVEFERGNKRTMASSTKILTLDSIDPNIIRMEYAVRGPLVIRAGEIEKEIKQVQMNPNNEPRSFLNLGFMVAEQYIKK